MYGIRRSGRSRREPDRLEIKEEEKEQKLRKHSNQSSNSKSSGWSYEDSSSESDEDREAPPPSKRVGAKRDPRKDRRKPKPVIKSKKHSHSSRRQSYSSEESSLDSDEDTRRAASRRATTTVSYKEASDDDKTDSEDLVEVECNEAEVPAETEKCETIERVLGQRRGKKGITGNITTIYAVEENGDPNDVDENDLENTETQYQIKWKDWAHIHNTWESELSLTEQKVCIYRKISIIKNIDERGFSIELFSQVKGMKKLENFVKREVEIGAWRKHATPEDIEYYECQMELQLELLKSYNNVERIIAQYNKPDDAGLDYCCKWESLPYCDATWEDSSLIAKKWPEKIAEFKDREESKRTPSRHTKVLKYRPKFQEIKVQPMYMGVSKGLVLRDYQMDGLNWLIHSWCKENSVILADEMGLGKTIQVVFRYRITDS